METAGLALGYIAVIGGLMFAAVPIAFHHQREKRKRELEHIERMRALELGRTLPQDVPWLSPTKIGALMGTIVPIGVFVPAWLATQLAGYHETIWVAAAMVGLAAVIGGSTLVVSSLKHEAGSSDADVTKPYVEEDAYDVVSSRG
jgi:hypothetical protein